MPPRVVAGTLPRLLDPSLAHLRDITLVPARSPGRTLSAHRFVLAAASPVLRASLAADPTAALLTLAHADYDALYAVLQAVYGRPDAVAKLPAPALWSALGLCIAYAVLAPLDAVQVRIVESVTVANLFYHWGMADKYALDAVQLRCRNVVKDNFVVVARTPEFLHTCPQTIARVLRIHDLMVHSEDDVFQALERWLAYDVDARAEHALHLLRLVRLPTISDRILLRVCRSPYFGGHNEFYQLLLEALIRRTEVRIVHGPRIKSIERKVRSNDGAAFGKKLAFSPMGVTDTELLPHRSRLSAWPPATKSGARSGNATASKATKTAAAAAAAGAAAAAAAAAAGCVAETSRQGKEGEEGEEAVVGKAGLGEEEEETEVDYNRREDRTVLFEGLFPLRWYKSVRFRPRSAFSLLFTVVIPRWSHCRRRFISESRSFLNHKWSMWVDPYSADPTRAARDPSAAYTPDNRAYHSPLQADPLYVGNTLEGGMGEGAGAEMPVQEETDYISIYLCCESELGGSHKVEARVDFGLFVVSTTEEYGMERKVCVGRTFRSHGQAMGFRRHIRRNRLHSAEAALYNSAKDELVVGAHLVAPDVERAELNTSSFSLSRASGGDDFRSESPLSPPSVEGSRMNTMETEPSPILTATSRVTA